MKPAASQTAHRLAATSLAGLIVGLISAFFGLKAFGQL